MAFSLLFRMACNPRTTGTIFPSSKVLARVMAAVVPRGAEVIELGAGTGPVTAALLERGLQNIVAVELQASLAQQLSKKYPAVKVLNATAQKVLRNLPAGRAMALVSSLPFKSLPRAVRMELEDEIHSLLDRRPGSVLIQFTYSLSRPFAIQPGYQWTRVAFVVRNLPPAWVWSLTKTP